MKALYISICILLSFASCNRYFFVSKEKVLQTTNGYLLVTNKDYVVFVPSKENNDSSINCINNKNGYLIIPHGYNYDAVELNAIKYSVNFKNDASKQLEFYPFSDEIYFTPVVIDYTHINESKDNQSNYILTFKIEDTVFRITIKGYFKGLPYAFDSPRIKKAFD